MPSPGIALSEALDLCRTGDLWLFRGHSVADAAIRLTTNAPVNHVGMAVVLEDLPPLMWHAELGRSLPDMWSGKTQRGVQLHDMRAAVETWVHRYGQRAWLRQLEPGVDRPGEDALLRTIARLDGTPFPTTAGLAAGWLRGRLPARGRHRSDPKNVSNVNETAYCAEVVALTYQDMGVLPRGKRPSWYDPGRFWSGDDLEMTCSFRLATEVAVIVPTS